MRYNAGDIVKINELQQEGYDGHEYRLFCPYVEVLYDYDSEHDDMLAAYATYYVLQTGTVLARGAYTFDPVYSTLVERAAEVDA